MVKTFLDHIGPFLQCCNFIGLTYVSGGTTNKSLHVNFVVILRSMLILALYTFCNYNVLTSESWYLIYTSDVSKFGDLLGTAAAVICHLTKLLYYYVKKSRVRELIFEANTLVRVSNNNNMLFTF